MHCQLIVEVDREQAAYTIKKADGTVSKQTFQSHHISREQIEALARYMAPIRLKRSSASDIPSVLALFEMMDIQKSTIWMYTDAGKRTDIRIHYPFRWGSGRAERR